MRRLRGWWRVLVAALLVAGIAVMVGFGAAGDLSGRGVATALTGADPRWLILAAGLVASGYAAAGQAIRGASAGRLERGGALLLPYAGAAANRALPAGTGGIAVTSRVLAARGLPLPAALGVAVAAAAGTGLAGAGLLAAAAACTATGLVRLPGLRLPLPHLPAVWACAAGVAVAAVWLAHRHLPGWRASASRWATHLPAPAVLARFTAFEVINRLAQVGALVACTTAVGQPLDVGPAIVALAASGLVAGLIPVAGGAGSVEITLTLALHAAGLSYPAAAAATILTRIIGYWGPALLGLPALFALLARARRRPQPPHPPAVPLASTLTVSRSQAAASPGPLRAVICAFLACATAATAAIYG